MPSLSQIGDNETLDNRFAAKTIVYAESQADVDVFMTMLGPDVRDRLEVKTPPEGEGCGCVVARVARERRDNARVFGLLDGEAAAALGETATLIEGADAVFRARGREGILFIAGHEIENVLLEHAGVDVYISHSGTLARPSPHDPVLYERRFRDLRRRFFRAGLLKYVSVRLHEEGRMRFVPPLGRFMSDHGRPALMDQTRSDVEAAGMDWEVFRQEACALLSAIRDRLRLCGSHAARNARLLRLCDGKGFLAKLRGLYGIRPEWERRLVANLVECDHARQFRSALFALTGTR